MPFRHIIIIIIIIINLLLELVVELRRTPPNSVQPLQDLKLEAAHVNVEEREEEEALVPKGPPHKNEKTTPRLGKHKNHKKKKLPIMARQ